MQDPKKVIVKDVRALGGAPKVIRGNVQIDNLIYKNLLYHGRPTFRASYFDSVYISSVREADKLYQRLTIRDTTIEPMLGNVENNKIISALHYDIAMPEHRLARYTGVVWLFDGWQYELKEFSPITPLPSTATLADYFNVEKLASEYVFEQYDPNAFAKREIPEITAGAKLPDFTLNDLNGNAFAAAKQENGLILLDFWYKGCFPCQLAMPKLENLHQKFGSKGLAVLGVDPIDKDPGKLKEWLKTRNITYNTLFDPEKSLAKAVGVTGYPLLILVDAKTKEVLHVHSGFSETLEETLEPIIKEHLGL
ncbi:MAG: TlpA family protein disulfide reductase [Saprospiraceae bacterium]|nr:TlpA family protein disulfide reductase [Saprospiraceae bacterium]